MPTCDFNGAKDAGESRFDPRFDCAAEAMWHVLLAQDEQVSSRGQQRVFACEEHVMNVYNTMTMYHRVVAACVVPGTMWRLTRNRCEQITSRH